MSASFCLLFEWRRYNLSFFVCGLNAERLSHPKWKSKTGRFWICSSSVQVRFYLCSPVVVTRIKPGCVFRDVLWPFFAFLWFSALWHWLARMWEHLIMCLQKFGRTYLTTIKGEQCSCFVLGEPFGDWHHSLHGTLELAPLSGKYMERLDECQSSLF